MYYVYILKLSNSDYYIGRTDNLKRRIAEHLNRSERTTKRFLPCKLVTYISFEKRDKSFKFEKYLKTGSGLAFRKRHLI
jgi:putative endonuclease